MHLVFLLTNHPKHLPLSAYSSSSEVVSETVVQEARGGVGTVHVDKTNPNLHSVAANATSALSVRTTQQVKEKRA
jgi:hypothetical protein